MKVSRKEGDSKRVEEFMKLIKSHKVVEHIILRPSPKYTSKVGCPEDRCTPPFTKWTAVQCYRQLVMESFKQINASWITHIALCNHEKWGWMAGEDQDENLQETYLEVYSANRCHEKFPNM